MAVLGSDGAPEAEMAIAERVPPSSAAKRPRTRAQHRAAAASAPGPASGGGGAEGIIILRYPNSIVWGGGTGLTYGSHIPISGTDERYIKFTQGNGYITITTQ